MINLSIEQRNIINRILDARLPGREAMAFGSRATSSAKPYSDLDIAIMGDEPFDLRTMALLKDAFAESDLPFRVDVVQWCKISPEFKKIIQSQLQCIHKAALS